MPSSVCRVVMFSMCIVFSIGSECGPAEYKTGAECCPMCGKGSVVHRHCTSDSSTTCIPCIRGTYMDEPNGLTRCLPCSTCDPGQGLIFLNECTTTSNAVCDAKDGFYCKSYSKNKECSYAIKHSKCSPGEYLKVPGTKTADTQCEQCPHGYFSTYGVSCTAWTKCNFDQQKTAEGTKTNDTVCENIPERSRLWILGPVLLIAVLCAGLTGNYFKEGWMKVYLLLLFCGLAYSCGSAEYEINGECCPRCTPGTHVYKHCTEFANTSCVPCTQKSFIAVPTGLSHCLSCTVCEPDLGLKTERECTPTSDTVCEPLDHHYCTKTDNKGCRFAQKHTICRPGHFIIHNGTTSTNTECGYCPDKTFSNESFSAYCKPHRDCQSLGLQEITAGTSTSDSECGPRNIPVSIVISCLVSVLLASAVILAIIFILKRRKKKAPDLTEGVRMNSASQPQNEGQ